MNVRDRPVAIRNSGKPVACVVAPFHSAAALCNTSVDRTPMRTARVEKSARRTIFVLFFVFVVMVFFFSFFMWIVPTEDCTREKVLSFVKLRIWNQIFFLGERACWVTLVEATITGKKRLAVSAFYPRRAGHGRLGVLRAQGWWDKQLLNLGSSSSAVCVYLNTHFFFSLNFLLFFIFRFYHPPLFSLLFSWI